jgi:hypothetical protein
MAEGWVLFKQEWHLPSDWVYGNQDHISYIMEHTKFNKEEHYVPMEASLLFKLDSTGALIPQGNIPITEVI